MELCLFMSFMNQEPRDANTDLLHRFAMPRHATPRHPHANLPKHQIKTINIIPLQKEILYSRTRKHTTIKASRLSGGQVDVGVGVGVGVGRQVKDEMNYTPLSSTSLWCCYA